MMTIKKQLDLLLVPKTTGRKEVVTLDTFRLEINYKVKKKLFDIIDVSTSLLVEPFFYYNLLFLL